MSPGSRIYADTIVAMVSLATKKFTESNVILAGVPARVQRNRAVEDVHEWERTW